MINRAQLINRAQRNFGDRVSQGRDRMAVGRERMANVVNLFADQLTGAAKNTRRYVRSNPWQSVGALAVAGLAAGLLVTRVGRRFRQRPANSSAASEVSGG